MMHYRGLGLPAACDSALEKLAKAGGEGGVIALSRSGELTLRFNTEGMFRAFRSSGGSAGVAVFGD
jgi:beta-aspartyl-peptidase (threonine type)